MLGCKEYAAWKKTGRGCEPRPNAPSSWSGCDGGTSPELMNPANQKRWLVKFAPFRTPWAEIVRRGTFSLRGVRNRVARKYLKEMRLGDQVLYYHSQQELAVVGIMEVTREAYPDPTSTDPQWLTCDFKPTKTLVNPVILPSIKICGDTLAVLLGKEAPMKNTLGSIGPGLRVAAKSIVTPTTRYRVGNIPLICSVCGHDEFDRREMLMNTSGMTFLSMDWLNTSACALVCQKCRRIELFAETPSTR